MQKLLNTFPILSFVPVAANVAVVVAVGAPVAVVVAVGAPVAANVAVVVAVGASVAVGADADKIFLPTTQN